MSLDIVVFNRAGFQEGRQIQCADLPWAKTASLTVGGTATYTVPATLPNAILEITANGSNHTFHCGDPTNAKVLSSGSVINYTARAGLTITVTA